MYWRYIKHWPEKKFYFFLPKNLVTSKTRRIFALAFERYLSSVVEQWTENPRVPGSIPGGTTSKTRSDRLPAQPAVFFVSAFPFFLRLPVLPCWLKPIASRSTSSTGLTSSPARPSAARSHAACTTPSTIPSTPNVRKACRRKSFKLTVKTTTSAGFRPLLAWLLLSLVGSSWK